MIHDILEYVLLFMFAWHISKALKYYSNDNIIPGLCRLLYAFIVAGWWYVSYKTNILK